MHSGGHLRMLQTMWLQHGRNWYVGVTTTAEKAAHGSVVAGCAGHSPMEEVKP